MNDFLPIFNFLIIALTVYVSWQGFRNEGFLETQLFSTRAILKNREYRRMITSGFLHLDWMHLLFNMFSLYAFGRDIERYLGGPVFLLIYFSSIVGGSLLSLLVHRGHEYRALGASGGVCGVIFSSIFLFPGGGVMVFPLPFFIPSWLYAILFLLFSIFAMSKNVGDIGHDAHIGGAIIGLLVTTLLRPSIVSSSPVLYGTVMTIALGLFAYTCRRPLYLDSGNRSFHDLWQSILSRFGSGLGANRQKSDARELERLLDKISTSGMESLSAAEQARLKAISERKKKDDEELARQQREARLNYRR